MKATIVIEKAKDGGFGCYMVEALEQACLAGYGDSVEECKADLLEFYRECQQMHEGFPRLEFEWRYDIASFLNYYDFLNVSQLAKRIGINASLLRRYKTGVKATQRTYQKFAEGLRAIGAELASANL